MAPHRPTRVLPPVLINALVLAAVGLAAAPALADPAPPQNTSAALKQLQDVSSQAEIVTEQWKSAQEAQAGKQRELTAAEQDAARASTAADQARAEQQRYRGTVDTLASATYQGASLTELSAFLASSSPQDFLDRASALDLVARNTNTAVAGLTAAVAKTGAEEQRTTTARGQAQAAAADAARLAGDVAARAAAMGRKVDAAKAALAALTAADKARLADPGPASPPSSSAGPVLPVPSSGVGAAAVRAALSKIGSPYVWGAKGPSSFDCSGLAYWAYQQAGVAIGGSTSSQIFNGVGVSRSAIAPGDLVFFYSPVHHVGIAVDGNHVVHAPDFGQTVKISPIDAMPFNSARRVTG